MAGALARTVRRGRRSRAAVAVLVLLALGACASAALARTATVTVTETNGSTSFTARHARLAQGDTLAVVFSGSWYDGGYRWVLTGRPNRSLRASGTHTIAPKRCCGFPERTEFFYRAATRGSTTLVYTLTGPGRNAASKGRLKVNVTVGR